MSMEATSQFERIRDRKAETSEEWFEQYSEDESAVNNGNGSPYSAPFDSFFLPPQVMDDQRQKMRSLD